MQFCELITNFFPAASSEAPSASAYSYTAAGQARPSRPAYSDWEKDKRPGMGRSKLGLTHQIRSRGCAFLEHWLRSVVAGGQAGSRRGWYRSMRRR